MALRAVVLDFDGTFTLVDEEAIPFVESFRSGLERALGEPVAPLWEEAGKRVQADPDHYGWEYQGTIVAPSHADPYILASTIGQLLLSERLGIENSAQREILDGLFAESYPKASTVFRPDAREVVEEVLGRGVPVYVVTNSKTVHVKAKLEALAPRGLERLIVRGDAQKFALAPPSDPDPRFDSLPETSTLPGLGRPLYVRRGRYFDALSAIWRETGATPETTFICGDIFELDLAMPAALGVSIHQVARPDTPEYEREAVRSAGGTLSVELRGLLEHL